MIAIYDLSFGYSKRKLLFKELTLQLKPGCIHGLLGNNGTGKTTLLKLIGGLIYPKNGNIELDGQNPASRKPSLYSRIFFIPEEFAMPAVSLSQYVGSTSGFFPKFSRESYDYYIQEFQVDQHERMDRISMGQKKKALLSFALACNTEYLLMDEPTNGLDIPSKGVFRRLIAQAASPEKVIIISTHQVRDIENLIDNVAILNTDGMLINRTTEEISCKLEFRKVLPDEDALYAEESIQGLYGVIENNTGAESKLNLELLFNASVSNPDRIRNIFNN